MISTSKFVSLAFLGLGVFLLMQITLPIVGFKFWEKAQQLSPSFLISPQISKTSQVLGISVENQDNFPQFVSTSRRPGLVPYTRFLLSVPKLHLENEIVEVDSNDLSRYLAHLPGTALPGEKGNVFISGHSAIPFRMGMLTRAIFANLTDMKQGDLIYVTANNNNFVYQVVDIKVVDPSDVSVIAPPEPIGRYISLMTCVPPGLNTKRLIVIGKMV